MRVLQLQAWPPSHVSSVHRMIRMYSAHLPRTRKVRRVALELQLLSSAGVGNKCGFLEDRCQC